MSPPDGGRPISTIKITDWKRVSTGLEKIDTPPLNSIPDDIRSTEEIDHAIGALTSHVRTVVEKCERKVPASSDHRKFPPDIFELIRAKNKALRRASAYPTPEYRSRARALQREVKARVQEFRNESWSDLMEEIRPSHKAFWKITKALKTEGYTPIPPLKRPDGTTALDDAEVAECIADSKLNALTPPHDIAHINSIEEELTGRDFNACLQTCYFPSAWKEAELIGIHKPGKPRDLPASYRPISLLSGLAKLFERVLKTRLSNHLFGKGLIIDEQFGFRPAHSCPQQVLRLVEYVTEGFKTKQNRSCLFDVAKAFDRVWHAGMSVPLTRRLIRAGVRKAPPSPVPAYTNDIPRPTSASSLRFRRRYRSLYRNRTHRSDSSTSRDHIPMLLRAAVDYQPPPPTHFIRRPRNVLLDPPDALTAAVDSLNDVNDTHD
ncbi:Probable RNA-directed DNA polymerase from transposon X-element [Eumeta japonica]|uniref:Probable RNA-directed DNA polymerase from transposon X-element n=1 Tax=Eumeta variegata TaxID=151549 RepID=A0A4C1SRN8_EUMVA|nr:Probable RNA-directed DNA polymerase from transposon X-element [Eumeta japonica]